MRGSVVLGSFHSSWALSDAQTRTQLVCYKQEVSDPVPRPRLRREVWMNGIRHFLRDFTASAVREHLRSQIEATDGSPRLTKNEVELVRFMCGEGSFDWNAFLVERFRI